jgi:hypothetical protein
MLSKVVIAPRRSIALYALLTMAMVVASYVFVILLATACVYAPYSIMSLQEALPYATQFVQNPA